MSWVRYDDQLEFNAKVTKAILADPGSMSLHLVANTWTSKTRHKGYVPRHQPGALLCDRETGAKYADIMVMVRLWHDVNDMCPVCVEEYAGDALPTDADGWVFHNHREYRPPARERQTPGTPTELSEKRAAAGRKGGKASSATRAKQTARANEANGASKASKPSSNSVSPDPVPEPVVASNEATTSPPVGAPNRRRTGSKAGNDDADPQTDSNVKDIVAAYIKGATAAKRERPADELIGRVGRTARRLLGQRKTVEQLTEAAYAMGEGGWIDLALQLQRMSGNHGRASPQTDGRHVSTQAELDDWRLPDA